MKALVCLACVDIRALPPTGAVTCRCGNAQGAWVDPARGTMRVWAQDRGLVRVLGMHNSFLRSAMNVEPYQHGDWKALHEYITTELSDGYLFNAELRGCWACLIRVGESSDTSWSDEPL